MFDYAFSNAHLIYTNIIEISIEIGSNCFFNQRSNDKRAFAFTNAREWAYSNMNSNTIYSNI